MESDASVEPQEPPVAALKITHGLHPPSATPEFLRLLQLEIAKAAVDRYFAEKQVGHFVYAISDGEWTKIGYSNNVRKRMRQLQTSNPRSLECVGASAFDTERQARAYERKVRWLLRKHFNAQVRGEWINVAGDLVATFLQTELRKHLV